MDGWVSCGISNVGKKSTSFPKQWWTLCCNVFRHRCVSSLYFVYLFSGAKMTHHFLYYLTECWHNLNCGFENYAICKRSSGKTYIAAAPTVSPIGGCPENWTKLASGVRHPVHILHQEHSKYWLILQLKETHSIIYLFYIVLQVC